MAQARGIVSYGGMDRREFLRNAVFGACTAGSPAWLEAKSATQKSTRRIDFTIDRNQRLGPIPVDFMGLGYEISSIATPGLLSASNRAYVGLVRRLGERGVIRIGGNTSDYSSFAPRAAAVSPPKCTKINEAGLRDLAGFLDATGWSLIWGLNLGNGSVDDAVAEARAVAHTVGDSTLGGLGKTLTTLTEIKDIMLGAAVPLGPGIVLAVETISDQRGNDTKLDDAINDCKRQFPGAPYAFLNSRVVFGL